MKKHTFHTIDPYWARSFTLHPAGRRVCYSKDGFADAVSELAARQPAGRPGCFALQALLAAVLMFSTILPAATMATTLNGNVAELRADGWLIQNLSWSIDVNAQSSLKIATLTISQLPTVLSEIVLTCSQTILTTQGGQCLSGTLVARVGEDPLTGVWQAGATPEGVVGEASLTLPAGQVTVTVAQPSVQSIRLVFAEVSLSALSQLWPDAIPQGIRGLQASIGAELEVQLPPEPNNALADEPATGLTIDGTWAVNNLSFDSEDGTLAGADLAVSGAMNAVITDLGELDFSAEVTVHDGELLVDPAYISFSDTPDLNLSVSGARLADGSTRIDHWQLGDGDALTVTAAALLSSDGQLKQAEITLEQLLLSAAWPRYFSAISDSKGLAGLTGEGTLQAQLSILDGVLEHVSMAADEISASTENGRFAVQKLNGVVDYSATGDSSDSALSWNSLSYYTLVVGAASSRFFVGGGQLQLLQPLFLPVLDGGLRIDELAVDNLGTEQTAMDFRGELKPMALDQITKALDWPELQGTLGGSIPQVRLRNQVVEVGGSVVIDVFGGQVTMNQLKLERVFGVLPTLAADVVIADVDLEQMTGAFSFGKIEGVLMGKVGGLRLLNWKPVAFDLDLQTRRNSGVRQRISQRAVDNLSSIGGGVAALGSTVLRIFDDFGYQQLGLSCELRNNTCTMGGVGDSGNGYYLVRGSGIPRIDIKGFSRRVDWPQLVRRLKAATESGPVSVE